MSTIDDNEYKLAKEAFVSGLQGTTAREVFAVFALTPVRFVARFRQPLL